MFWILFGVRAHDSVRTRNLHPRQQSGFHHRVIAVKPLLTGWCGSQRLVKCNVPQDPILAIALLHRDSFFISMSFLLFSIYSLLPPLHFHCLSLLFSHSSAGAVKPSERAKNTWRNCGVAPSIFGSTLLTCKMQIMVKSVAPRSNLLLNRIL